MKYVKGNLLDLAEQGEFDIIVQGCNCQNTMGSGLAKQIKERYPKAYLADQVTQKGDASKVGCFTQAHVNGTAMIPIAPGVRRVTPGARGLKQRHYSFTIVNAYTQVNYGSGQQYVDYSAIARVFKQIKLLYDLNTQVSIKVGIPKIGAERGGGDWSIIEQIIDEIGFSNLTCVEYNGAE